MKNVKIDVKGTVMTIVVDLSKTQGASASGKTMIIATTSGAAHAGDVEVNLNVYKKN